MAWTSPTANLNAEIRDNLSYLKELDGVSDTFAYSTTTISTTQTTAELKETVYCMKRWANAGWNKVGVRFTIWRSGTLYTAYAKIGVEYDNNDLGVSWTDLEYTGEGGGSTGEAQKDIKLVEKDISTVPNNRIIKVEFYLRMASPGPTTYSGLRVYYLLRG